jgi:putative transposase
VDTVHKAFQYRLYPTQEQEAALAVQFGHARFTWNTVLALRNQHYADNKESIGYDNTAGLLVWLKEQPDTAFLKEAHSQVLQQKLKDQQAAFDNFFRRLREGIHPAGFPQFKSKHDKQSIRYPQPPASLVVQGKINLLKVGWVKIILHRPYQGKVKSITVSKTKTGKYFASILCEVPFDPPPRTGPAIGCDLGLIDFITFSDPECPPIPLPKWYQNSLHHLAQLQRKLARQQKGSKGREKTRQRIALLYEKIANQRQDFQHKISTSLTQYYGLAAFEDLNIKGMVKNKKLAKAIHNAAWSEFLSMCKYKDTEYGCEIVQVDQYFASSKTCHACGEKNTLLTLSERTWICPACGQQLDRDHNAALNILHEALKDR